MLPFHSESTHLASSEELDVCPPVVGCKSLAFEDFGLAVLSQLVLVLPQAGQHRRVLPQLLAKLLGIADASSCQRDVSIDVACIRAPDSASFKINFACFGML